MKQQEPHRSRQHNHHLWRFADTHQASRGSAVCRVRSAQEGVRPTLSVAETARSAFSSSLPCLLELIALVLHILQPLRAARCSIWWLHSA